MQERQRMNSNNISRSNDRQRMNSYNVSRSYDVIFVGQLGAVAAHHFLKHINFPVKCLVINNTKVIIQPSLSSIYSEKIKIYKLAPQQCDLQIKAIRAIRPIINQVQMESGHIYYYRSLVYGQNNWADLQCIPKLQEALSNQYSLVYSNWIKTDLSKIYKYDSGNLIFYVPRNRHSGYQNYNFLSIYQNFLKSKSNCRDKLKCKVILQGTSFFPFNEEGDQFIKSQLRSNGIQLILNSKITKIDYLRRRLKINDRNEISYTIFYCILCQKTPQILKNAEIDPQDNHSKGLFNKKYRNIFIFGADIFPTTHSFTAINHQAHIIRHNLINIIQKKEQFAWYNGQTSIKFWINEKETVQISHKYNQSDQISSNCFKNYLKYLNYKTLSTLEVQIFYNLNSDGQPFYLLSPTYLDYKASQTEHQDKNSIRGLKSNLVIQTFNPNNYRQSTKQS